MIDEIDSNERLKSIFGKVGKEYRYDTVQAEFMAFTEVKVRWQRPSSRGSAAARANTPQSFSSGSPPPTSAGARATST